MSSQITGYPYGYVPQNPYNQLPMFERTHVQQPILQPAVQSAFISATVSPQQAQLETMQQDLLAKKNYLLSSPQGQTPDGQALLKQINALLASIQKPAATSAPVVSRPVAVASPIPVAQPVTVSQLPAQEVTSESTVVSAPKTPKAPWISGNHEHHDNRSRGNGLKLGHAKHHGKH